MASTALRWALAITSTAGAAHAAPECVPPGGGPSLLVDRPRASSRDAAGMTPRCTIREMTFGSLNVHTQGTRSPMCSVTRPAYRANRSAAAGLLHPPASANHRGVEKWL